MFARNLTRRLLAQIY